MQYKTKFTALSAICGALFIAYILSFVFAPENRAARSAAWTLLSARNAERLEKIEISGGEAVNIEKKSGVWSVLLDGKYYPANTTKIDDLLSGLQRQGPFVVRSKSEKAFEKFGVDENSATRIVLRGANNALLLDLLVGSVVSDLEGEDYLRKTGETEVRSGKLFASSLLSGGRKPWFDLRLFPDHDKNGLTVDSVQRAAVYMPKTEVGAPENGAHKTDWIIARTSGGWQFEGSETAVDTAQAENYIRSLLDANADDYVSSLSPNDTEFTALGIVPGRIILDLGDGSNRIITLGREINAKKTVSITGSDYIYSLTNWYLERLWRDRSELEVK